MFEWLEHEIAIIKMPRFHVVDGPATGKLREVVTRSGLPLPESYRKFALRFGNAKLYRNARNDSYRIGVFAGPRAGKLDDGTLVYEVGFHDSARVFIEPIEGSDGGAVWEVETGSPRRVNRDFGEWLEESCALARQQYTAEEWAGVVQGPNPFTPEEQEAVNARRRISWQLTGIDTDGSHIFEVQNSNNRSIPVLTIGVRSKDGRLNGATVLQIGHVGPGQTATVRANCYKELRSPEEIEVFDLPEPRPEDREFFAEFAALSRNVAMDKTRHRKSLNSEE